MKTRKLKQPYINRILKDWETVAISDAFDVNPKRELKKGTSAKYVSMSDLMEFNKNIHNFCIREYKGGSKFMNDDTIMARITPCLENGKTAFVDFLNENETGSGSTEFIVLSAKQGWTTPHYVYYLAISPEVREQAIQSMTGTSGRQRVDTDVFDNIFIKLPPVNIQFTIAKILSDLDEKIELNRQMNKTLESIAQAIFKHWFVDFEFPDENGKPYKSSGGKMVESELGKMPIVWDVGTFQEMCDITMGQSPPGKTYNETGKGIAFYQGNRDFGFRFPMTRVFCTSPTRFAKKGDVLISVRAPVGALNIAKESCAVGRGLAAIRMKNYTNSFVYYFLKSNTETWNVYDSEGTVFGSINKSTLHKMKLVMPHDIGLTKFDKKICAVDTQIFNNEMQNFALAQIRDSLLPKLMSGEINTINN